MSGDINCEARISGDELVVAVLGGTVRFSRTDLYEAMATMDGSRVEFHRRLNGGVELFPVRKGRKITWVSVPESEGND